MKLIVNPHKIELIKEEAINEKEINISKCTFEFSEEYSDNLVKEAYFTLNGNSYKQIISNNECSFPPEVLEKEGTVELGVVAYEVQDEEYVERFNPSPVYFQTWIGSLKDHAENSEEITPSELEQYEQALNDGLLEAQRVNIDATKTGNTATVTITNRQGTEKTVEIYDGEKGEDGQPGVTPNIEVGNTTTLPAGSSATVTQRGTTENPIFDFGIPKGADGEGKVSSVNGQTGDVVINVPDVSNFITKDVDNLTNYYKKTETYTKTEVDNKVSSVYRYRGTVSTYGDLPTTGLVVGDVYNVEQADSEHGIQAGDNVAWNGSTWDKLSGNVDLSGYQPLLVSGTNIKTINNTSILGSGNFDLPSIQYITMPTASADNLGQIVQFTGTTDSTYTNGYFYVCVSDDNTYSWENIEVQPSSGGIAQGLHTYCKQESTDIIVHTYILFDDTNPPTNFTSLTNSFRNTLINILNSDDLKNNYDSSIRNDLQIFAHYGAYGNGLKMYKFTNYTPSATTLNGGGHGYTSFRDSKFEAISQEYILCTLTYTNNVVTNVVFTVQYGEPMRKFEAQLKLTNASGYASNKTQTLINDNGTLKWQDGSGGGVDIDNTTITTNASDKIQAVGIIDQQTTNADKIWTGTLVQYNALISGGTIDSDTFYVITDDDASSTLRQKVEVVTSQDTSYTIANLVANKSYKLGELTALTITACETFDEESVIYFDSGSTATTLSLPNDVVVIGDEIEASKSYIISVLNKIAVIKGYEVE